MWDLLFLPAPPKEKFEVASLHLGLREDIAMTCKSPHGMLQLLELDTPGKVEGQPGNAFELVYGSTTKVVRQKMHSTDPTLCEWIR